jgi:Flp pilus assembly protein TadG
MRHAPKPRTGAAAIEFAVICPVLLLFIVGLLVGGLGIFRYQEIAAVARECSRWASVHGGQYQQETGNAAATAQDVYNTIILPQSAALDLSQLTYSVTWNTSNNPYHTVITNGQLVPVTNTVTVSISYQWIPEAYFGGGTLTSTSVTPMSY